MLRVSIGKIYHNASQEHENNDVYLHIIPMDKALLKLIRVTHLNVGGSFNLDEFVMFPTVAEGKRFLNIEVIMQKDGEKGKGMTVTRYHFVKYEVSVTGRFFLQLV